MWLQDNGERHITDNLLRQRGFDQLFNTNYDKGTSNEELMLYYGLWRYLTVVNLFMFGIKNSI